jgi:transglutaminase-like putative cysteine protease
MSSPLALFPLPCYRITHRTSYRYQSMVSLCHNVAHLIPRTTGRQRCLNTDLQVDPPPKILRRRLDHFGNDTWYFSIESAHQHASVTSLSDVEVNDGQRSLPVWSPPWEQVHELLGMTAQQSFANPTNPSSASPNFGGPTSGDFQTVAFATEREYLLESPFIPISDQFADYAWRSFTPGRPILDAMSDLTARIFREFTFDPEATTLATPVAVVFRERKGVCQDFAHLILACLRSIGLAARYVSGYLETDPPPGRERLVGADASHAWVSIFAGELGWFDFDPTNNLIPGDRHITISWGRDYGDVSPLQGVILGGGAHELDVSVDVARIYMPNSWENTAI